MFEYFTNAISSALGFSKTEARGTLILILIIFSAIITTQASVYHLKNESVTATDSTTLEWVKKVQASYKIKDVRKPDFDKPGYLPVKKSSWKKEEKTKKEVIEPTEEKSAFAISDLNIAAAEDLQKVRGIGPAYSQRIIKYRELLGGFSDTTQLKEVYGLKPQTISELLISFQIQSNVTPININSDSITVLSKHPYISYDLARNIINYRRQHGDIENIEDLRNIKSLDDVTFLRLKPYLK